jgi:hypothetical protein
LPTGYFRCSWTAAAPGVARCKKRTGGLEVNGVFTPGEFRGKGLADLAIGELVKNCGKDVLFMHSTLVLVRFYRKFGWKPVPGTGLPVTIKERLIFCFGEMEGCNAVLMRRQATL